MAAVLAIFGALDLRTRVPSGAPNPSDDICAATRALGVWMLVLAAAFLAAGVITCARNNHLRAKMRPAVRSLRA